MPASDLAVQHARAAAGDEFAPAPRDDFFKQSGGEGRAYARVEERHGTPFEVNFINRVQSDLAPLMRQHARVMNLDQFSDDVLEEADDAMFGHINSLNQAVRVERGVVRWIEFQNGNVGVCHFASLSARAS